MIDYKEWYDLFFKPAEEKKEEIKPEFILSPEQLAHCTIEFHGNETKVTYDGKYIGVSKCNPEDKYDFNIGIKLAYDRATENKKKAEEDDKKIKVGDTVKVVSPGGDFCCDYKAVTEKITDKELIARFAFNDFLVFSEDKNDTFTVRYIDNYVAYIEDNRNRACRLIRSNAIKKV